MRPFLGWLVAGGLAFAAVPACGGRFSDERGSDDDASGNQSAKAGRSSGGSKGSGGGSTGGGYAGGSQPSGGAPAGCFCPDVECPPGFGRVPNPDGCCASCRPLPCSEPCAGIACASGFHLEVADGECCPRCVPDVREACAAGQVSYFDFRKQLIEKYSSLGCIKSEECGVLWENNRCTASCGVPLPAAFVNDATANLKVFAEMSCASCGPVPIPPCPAPAPLYCGDGACRGL